MAALPVVAENRTGYSRALFPHWIDAGGDGCDTRREVLIDEATVAPERCRYLGDWVAVKMCWSLSVDRREVDALAGQAAVCPNVTITVNRVF